MASTPEIVKCPNAACKCPDCTCGLGCTCGVSMEVSCDPCNEFKANMEAKKARVRDEWLQRDFDQESINEFNSLSTMELDQRFKSRLKFGTAGLRASMGMGSNRMNSLTVLQTSQGLCEYLMNSNSFSQDASNPPTVVIGFDGRKNSQKFAHVAASVFIAKSIRVLLFPAPTATPLTPFIVARYQCIAGIQITASHNPKDDNGYKLYGPSGAQIMSPVDSEVEACIEKNLEPWQEAIDCLDLKNGILLRDINQVSNPYSLLYKNSQDLESAEEKYLEMMTDELSLKQALDISNATEADQRANHTPLPPARFVYTAMHGVGWDLVSKLWSSFGFSPDSLVPVEEQKLPDPNFPTVVFPNPEEKGALDLALGKAVEVQADYVIANDPDADRFTGAERQADGSWVMFSGDQLGILFADWQLTRFSAQKLQKENTMNDASIGFFVTSVVSSRMLAKFAKLHNCEYQDTLTGFKYMANQSIAMRNSNPNLRHLLAYEESIGYQLSGSVPDKDGVSAACVWAEMTNHYRLKGMRVYDRLIALQQDIGIFVTNNGYFVCPDPQVTKSIFDEFRSNNYQLGPDHPCSEVRDVTLGIGSDLPPTPKSEMIQFTVCDVTVTLRASGTEPKLKHYTEYAAKDPDPVVAVTNAKRVLHEVVELLAKWFYQPDKFNVIQG